jgi:hypothetical protein
MSLGPNSFKVLDTTAETTYLIGLIRWLGCNLPNNLESLKLGLILDNTIVKYLNSLKGL